MPTAADRLRDVCEAVAKAARRDRLLLEVTHHSEASCVIQLEHAASATHALLHLMVEGGTLVNEAGETLSLPLDVRTGFGWGDHAYRSAEQVAHFVYVWARGYLFGREADAGSEGP